MGALSPLPVLPVIPATPQASLGAPLSEDWFTQANANLATQTDIPQVDAPVRTTGTTTSTSTPTNPTVTGAINAIGNMLGLPSGVLPMSNVNGVNPPSNWLTRGVFITLGLLLVAAGIFSFNKSQTIITTAGKGAARLAEVTA